MGGGVGEGEGGGLSDGDDGRNVLRSSTPHGCVSASSVQRRLLERKPAESGTRIR